MREKIIELLGEDVCMHDCCDDCECQGNEDMCIALLKANMADHLIANDVVLVVRCKDCKNNGQCSIQDAMNWTPKTEIVDYFCSYGERKDNA